jgi:hypothetical protein
VPESQRNLWLILLLLGNFMVMPVYWWLYVRVQGTASAPDRDPVDAAAGPTASGRPAPAARRAVWEPERLA